MLAQPVMILVCLILWSKCIDMKARISILLVVLAFMGLLPTIYMYMLLYGFYADAYDYVNYLWFAGMIYAMSQAGNMWEDLNVSIEARHNNKNDAINASDDWAMILTSSGIFTEDRLIAAAFRIFFTALALYLLGLLMFDMFGVSTYYIYYLASGLAFVSMGIFFTTINVLSFLLCVVAILNTISSGNCKNP